YFTIADEENIEFDLLKKGILRFYDSQKEFKEDAEKKSWIEQPGMEWEVMSPDEVVALEPSLTTANSKNKIVGGVYTKSDASGDIHKFCINLEKVLVEKYDVRVLTDTSVSNLSQRSHKILVEYNDGQNLDSEEYENVVICAGVNTQNFANKLGDSMNVYPVKGYSVTIDLKNEQSKKGAPMVSLIDQPVKIVASRLGDKFRVAGTAELAGINTDIRQDRIRPLLRWVKEFFPEVRTESYTPWAGLRPMTPNMMPLTHESKMPGVFYHTGHGHLGWTLSAATAEIVAEKISSKD
ncbi:MAG: FAD-dependent oxidoreductase, partial [Gammaproteobacteria bacterium]